MIFATSTVAHANLPHIERPLHPPSVNFVTDDALSSPRPAPPTTLEPSREQILGETYTYLKHIYIMYEGLKSCSEISQDTKNIAFMPTVSLVDARRTLSAIDGATAALGIAVGDIWAAAAPKAFVTADGLKWDLDKSLGICHRIGDIFKVDALNIQSVLGRLGSKVTLTVPNPSSSPQ